MQILIIDNNIMKESWGSKELAQFAAKTAGATVHVRRAPQSDLPNDLSRFDRVVISGSMTAATDQHPWVHELDEKIRRYAGLGKPILGVCYGHQTLARCLGGVDYVSKKTSAEFGWTRIEQTAPSDLLKDLPKIFYSFSSHFDEVSKLPQGFRKLAQSERCSIQAFQVDDRPIFGIQFHPERNIESAKRSLSHLEPENRAKALLKEGDNHSLFNQKVGDTIFGNFFSIR